MKCFYIWELIQQINKRRMNTNKKCLVVGAINPNPSIKIEICSETSCLETRFRFNIESIIEKINRGMGISKNNLFIAHVSFIIYEKNLKQCLKEVMPMIQEGRLDPRFKKYEWAQKLLQKIMFRIREIDERLTNNEQLNTKTTPNLWKTKTKPN